MYNRKIIKKKEDNPLSFSCQWSGSCQFVYQTNKTYSFPIAFSVVYGIVSAVNKGGWINGGEPQIWASNNSQYVTLLSTYGNQNYSGPGTMFSVGI